MQPCCVQLRERALSLGSEVEAENHMKSLGMSPTLVNTPERAFGAQVHPGCHAWMHACMGGRALSSPWDPASLRCVSHPPTAAHPPATPPSPSLQLASSSSFPLGQPLLTRPGLAGWPHSDVYRSDSPDALHILDEGIAFYLLRTAAKKSCLLLRVLEECFPNTKRRAAALQKINTYLERHCFRWFDDRLPTNQLSCTETTGSRFAYMARCAAPALLTVAGLDKFVELLIGEQSGGQACSSGLVCGWLGFSELLPPYLLLSHAQTLCPPPPPPLPCSLPVIRGAGEARGAHRGEPVCHARRPPQVWGVAASAAGPAYKEGAGGLGTARHARPCCAACARASLHTRCWPQVPEAGHHQLSTAQLEDSQVLPPADV